MKKILFFFFIFFYIPIVIAISADSYLVKIGKQFLEQGRFQKAKTEFEKALQVNPSNKKAKKYLRQLRQKEIEKALDQCSEIDLVPEGKTKYVDNKVYY